MILDRTEQYLKEHLTAFHPVEQVVVNPNFTGVRLENWIP